MLYRLEQAYPLKDANDVIVVQRLELKVNQQ